MNSIKRFGKNLLHSPLMVGMPIILWQFFFVGIPLVCIIYKSFFQADNAFISVLTTGVYWKVIARSLALGGMTAVIASLIAYPFSYILVFKAGRYKVLGLLLVAIPFWTNFLLHVYAWFFMLERDGLINRFLLGMGFITKPLMWLHSSYAVVIMMVYYCLPFMILPLYTAFSKCDIRFFEASYDLGATWWQTIRRIFLPLTLSGLQSGFFLVFVPSCAEFAIPELMGGDRTSYIGTLISRLVLGGTGLEGLGAAYTLISATVVLVGALACSLMLGYLIRLIGR